MQVNASASNIRALLQRPTTAAANPAAAAQQPAKTDHIAKLQSVWGTNDPTYDLSKDGVVDGADLGLLLARLGDPAAQGQPVEPSTQPNGLDALLAAWGTANSDSDLNADGTVDGADLGLLLAGENPATAAPAQGPDHVAALQADWGKGDSQFDLNTDGTVDGADLGLLLGGAQPKPVETADPGSAQEALLAAWGTADAASDINKDGTVDGADLGLLLGSQGEAPMAQASTGPDLSQLPARLSDAILSMRDRDKDGQLSAAELGIGTSLFESLDSDKDGLVNGTDLTEAIARQLEKALEKDAEFDPAAFERRWMAALNPATVSAPTARMDGGGLANDLIGRLAAAGYRDTPPAGLRALIDGLNLNGRQSSQLLERLSQHYPPGSGVSVVA